jgi:DNA repair exonuclease SbcCD nuclease subunit
VKILHTSDWHLDAVTVGMRRIDDLKAAVQRTVDIAIEKKVDAYVFHGDLADPDCGSILVRVLAIAIDTALALAHADIPSFWIAGNHDVIEDGSGLTTLHPLAQLRSKVHVYEAPEIVMWDEDCEIVFLPFTSRTALYDANEFMQRHPFTEGVKRRMVFGHCTGLDGVVIGSESRDMARGAELPFPIAECRRQDVTLCVTGHWHRQQRTPDGVYIPGTLERLRFDEEGNAPGIFISES